MVSRQTTAVALAGRAILIEGPPGTGKSSLALSLIDRGAALIGDDSVQVETRGSSLFICPHPETRGLLEVRNIGLVPVSVCDEAEACLLIRLDPEAPRFIETAASIVIEGVALPWLALWPDSPYLAIKAEIALDRFGKPRD